MISPTDRAFGWDLPMGAERDPRAPWNERQDEIICAFICYKCEKKCESLNDQDLCEECQRILDEEGPQK